VLAVAGAEPPLEGGLLVEQDEEVGEGEEAGGDEEGRGQPR